MILLQSESPSGKCTKLHFVAVSNNRDQPTRSLCYCLFAPYIPGFYSSRTSRSWSIAHSTHRQLKGCNNMPSFLQRTAPIAHSFREGCIWHDLHVIMVTAPFCCDRKAQAASAQSFTLRQQATTEIITRRDHSLLVCATYEYMCVILHAHPVRGELHIQHNVNREVATIRLDWCMVFVTWPNSKPQPGISTRTSTWNLNPKPQPETSTRNLNPKPKPKT